MVLSDNEIRDITKLLESGKPLPDEFRFKLFEEKREAELVWNGKTNEVSDVVLPFQVIEQIDEPRSEKDTKLQINITEVSVPNLAANVIVQSIREDIEKRIPFRRVMKQNIDKVVKAGGQGVKIILAGRLNGVEIARSEKLTQGKIPLQTLRANIDYSRGVANTIYGVIGIKVWIYKGEYFDKKKKEDKGKMKAPTKSVKLFSKDKLNIQSIEPAGKKPVETEKKPVKK